VTCPPDEPLQRYGAGGDGTKYLCKLPEPTETQSPCMVYSMGSNGKLVTSSDNCAGLMHKQNFSGTEEKAAVWQLQVKPSSCSLVC
jgi:hypothetical protein